MAKIIKRKIRYFLSGMASSFDVFGALPTDYPAKMKIKTLSDDWRVVGSDMRHAMKKFDKERKAING